MKEATSRLLSHVAALVSLETKEENQRRHNPLSARSMEIEEEKLTKATTMETCINKKPTIPRESHARERERE